MSVADYCLKPLLALIEIYLTQCYIESMPSAGAVAARSTEDHVLSYSAEVATGMAAPDGALRTVPTGFSSQQLLERILTSLDEDKAEDVAVIDLRGRSEIADYMVVCSGRSSRQVSSISDKLSDRLKLEFGVFSKLEGKDLGDWVLIDAYDVIVHVFRPEVRAFYQLEKMWQPGGLSSITN